MNKKKLFEKYDLLPISIRKLNKVDILNTRNYKYVMKVGNNNNIYDYLKIKNFNNFIYPITDNNDSYEITRYIDDIEVPMEQRIEDLIYLTSILHVKTTFYKTIDTDYIKEIYEEQLKKQEYLYNYYSTLQDMIEMEVYMSPSHYLLIRNISDFYKCIRKSKEYIDRWYELIKDRKKMRYSMTHGNLDKSHIIENSDIYLISWNKARINSPVFDLASLYRLNQDKIDIFDLLDIYQTKYVLKEDEKCLLFSLILLPTKLEVKDTEFQNVKETRRVVEYIDNVKKLVLDNANY